MIISFQGETSFKISQGDLVLAINPLNNRSKIDIALFSTGYHESADAFAVTGPGEYEVKGVTIKGFLSEGASAAINTVYMVNFEGMNLCFLGALANPALAPSTLESLDDIDILFVPVDTLGPAAANKLAVSLEPKMVIPTRFGGDSLKQFLKESGAEKVEPLDKLVLKKKDLEGKEAEIVVLKEE